MAARNLRRLVAQSFFGFFGEGVTAEEGEQARGLGGTCFSRRAFVNYCGFGDVARGPEESCPRRVCYQVLSDRRQVLGTWVFRGAGRILEHPLGGGHVERVVEVCHFPPRKSF